MFLFCPLKYLWDDGWGICLGLVRMLNLFFFFLTRQPCLAQVNPDAVQTQVFLLGNHIALPLLLTFRVRMLELALFLSITFTFLLSRKRYFITFVSTFLGHYRIFIPSLCNWGWVENMNFGFRRNGR